MKNKVETKKLMFEQIAKGIDGAADISVLTSNKKCLLGFGANGLHGYSYIIYNENPDVVVIYNGAEELFRISKDSEFLIMLKDLISLIED